MATTQAKANPKKSSGFQGVKNAFFIILVCFVLAVLFFKYILGAPEHFVNGDPTRLRTVTSWVQSTKVVLSFL